jgi:hypothetical protein
MMILRSNIGANVQDAKTASFLWFRHKISYFPPAYAECGARTLLLGGRGGGDLRHRHVLGHTLSLIYFIVQTL